MQGGELFSFIQERAESAFTERGLLFKKTCFISILQNKYLNLLFSIKHLSYFSSTIILSCYFYKKLKKNLSF